MEKQWVFRTIVKTISKDKSNLEDILQEAFRKAFQCRKRFSSEKEAFFYLRRAVLSVTIDQNRKTTRYCNRFQPELGFETNLHRDDEKDPLSRLLLSEQLRKDEELVVEVRQAVQSLSNNQKQALEVFFGERNGRKIKDYCQDSGISYSTLRSRMLAGIDRIRERLRERSVSGFTEGMEDE